MFPPMPLRKNAKKERLAAALSLMRAALPSGIEGDLLKRWGYHFKSLPLSTSYEFNYQPLGEGGMNKVYLLESSDPHAASWVLKLCKIRELTPHDFLRLQREEVREIGDFFHELPELVLGEHYFIMEG